MKSIVLLSAGLDSSVCLARALRETSVELCLTFDYKQKAASQEINHARAMAEYYKIPHKVIKLDFFENLNVSALTNNNVKVPEPTEETLDQLDAAQETATTVWVPNRNGIFINIAAGLAETLDCSLIVTGFNAEEAKTFPDNSSQFVRSVNNSLIFGTTNKVQLVSYTQRLNKAEIVQLGRRLGMPMNYIWSCYHGGEEMCGKCESCLRYLRAIKSADSLEVK